MNQASMSNVARSMRLTGMLLFRDALLEALRSPHFLCVIHMAQAAEILLKARIADNSLLSIFSEIPGNEVDRASLSLTDLIENGRTFSYAKLPAQLTKTTGISFVEHAAYLDFGRLRNQLVHFSLQNQTNLDMATLKYGLEVLDPLVESFWGKSVLDFVQAYPWFDAAEQLEYGLARNKRLYQKFDVNPRLRQLLGRRAVADWQLYKKELEKEESERAEEQKWMQEEYETEETQMQDEYHRQQRSALEAEWQAFMDAFTSV